MMTSMVATGSQYAVAPTMTSMYANTASIYAPAATVGTTTLAAPATTYAAPYQQFAAPVTTVGAPSFVAAPQVVGAPVAAAPAVVETVAAPVGFPAFALQAPVSLVAGLVPPEKVEAERLGYEKALKTQLDKQVGATLEEAKIKKAMLEQTAKTQMAQFQLQIDEQLKMAQLQVDQEAQNMIIGLREAAITQQTRREETAAVAVADYNKKKALETMAQQSYALQKQWYDSEMKLTAEYQKVMQAGSRSVVTSAVPTIPAGGVTYLR